MAESTLPVLRVRINGAPLSQEALDDLNAVTVHEDVAALGMCTLRLFSWDAQTLSLKWIDDKLFAEGNAVEIQMGYGVTAPTLFAGEITGLEPTFNTEEPLTLTVRGYDQRHRLARGRKTRSFVQMKDSDIARQIANAAGLRAQVEDTKAKLEYVLQHNQSDLEFLQERAGRIGFEVAAEGKTLYFRPPPVDKTARVTLSLLTDLAEFLPRLSTMSQVGQVEVHGWDMKKKQVMVGKAGVGKEKGKMGGSTTGPQAANRASGQSISPNVSSPFFSQQEADQMATGRFNDIALSYITAEGSCLTGRSDIRAGMVVKIEGVGKRFSGIYYVTSATHTFTAEDGYRTSFTARRNAT